MTMTLVGLFVLMVCVWRYVRWVNVSWSSFFTTAYGEQTLTTQHVVPPLGRSARSNAQKRPKTPKNAWPENTPWTID